MDIKVFVSDTDPGAGLAPARPALVAALLADDLSAVPLAPRVDGNDRIHTAADGAESFIELLDLLQVQAHKGVKKAREGNLLHGRSPTVGRDLILAVSGKTKASPTHFADIAA